MCDFTGTRLQSDANPGKCTKTPGYLGYAEIMEIIRLGGNQIQVFHDHSSNTDVLLYKGLSGYSYPTTTSTLEISHTLMPACQGTMSAI
jgi:hypothetical protein